MPDVQSGWLHVADQFRVQSEVAAEESGNCLLLCLTRRGERCRSGSQVPRSGLRKCEGSQGRSRCLESSGLFSSTQLNLQDAEAWGRELRSAISKAKASAGISSDY